MSALRIYVPCDAAAVACGADEIATAIVASAAKRKIAVEIVRNGSRGLHWLEPLLEIATANGRIAYGPVELNDVDSIIDAMIADGGEHKLRVGVPEEFFADGLDPEVGASVRAAIRELEADGCVLRPVTLPHTRYAVATYYILATAEASSNLSRFDGVRYGLRVGGDAAGADLRGMYGATRDAGFGDEVKRRILLGTFVLSAGYYDAYYRKAQQVRTLVRRDFESALAQVDVICCPTSPTPAFRLGEKSGDPLAMYLNDIYTLPASLAGVPAMSVPCAPTRAGLPIGLQVIARPLEESTMLAVAAACEKRAPQPTIKPVDWTRPSRTS